MAQFVRIGDRLINLDLVTEIVAMPSYVNVNFGAEGITFRGAEAEPLRAFMAAQSDLEKTMGQPCYLCDGTHKCYLCGYDVCDHHASMRKHNGNVRLICDTCYFAE